MSTFNSHLFDRVELDSNVLSPQLVIVAQVRAAARYRGVVTAQDGTKKTFSLAVIASPAEPSVNIDVSQSWSGDITFTVVEKGFVVISVLSGPGGYSIRVYNDKEILLDNQSLQANQIVIARVLRPGKHVITDTTGGGTCNVTVSYPQKNMPMDAGKVDLKVKQIDAKHTEFDPKDLTVTVAQAIAIYVQDKSRITTSLLAKTDRVGEELVTTRV